MVYKIQQIEGIGPAYGAKLESANIVTTEQLLELCCDAKGRKDVAGTTGVTESQLLRWANMADLMRISGIGSEYSELLEAAGVDTVKELRNRNAENLSATMAEINAEKKLTRVVPSATVVSGWVKQAKDLNPVITH